MEISNSGAAARATSEPANRERIALVTGGTDGIGEAIAHVLAGRGICVVVVGSNADKGAAAADELRRSSGNDRVEFLHADLSQMRNVDALAVQVSRRFPQLHYLVLCASIMRGEYTLTPEGIETNFAVNYLSRFALTQAALPVTLRESWRSAAARRKVGSVTKTST
jgi:NAD(P)-dependent dehydrogenase (short-subunit alcohol dehydrogenase family)